MTKEEAMALHWSRRIPEFSECDADQLLGIALNCEQNARDVGPFDPAYTHFIQCAMDYEKAAYFKTAHPNL